MNAAGVKFEPGLLAAQRRKVSFEDEFFNAYWFNKRIENSWLVCDHSVPKTEWACCKTNHSHRWIDGHQVVDDLPIAALIFVRNVMRLIYDQEFAMPDFLGDTDD